MLNPSQIDMGIPTKEQLTLIVDRGQLVAKMQMQDNVYQIDNYHLKLPNKTRLYLFNHMIQFGNNNNKSYGSHLNVDIMEVQEVILILLLITWGLI